MNTSSYENKLIDAIETIVDSKVANAGYDKTIQAKIINCIDPTIGKYKVQYQDSTFYAYANSTETTFTNGADVYVLIPNNDMSRDKTILGTTEKSGLNYTNNAEGEEAYEIVGNNCITSNQTFELCSYKPETIVLYDKSQEENKISLNITSVETYIKQSSSIICGASFKTALPTEQQFKGNYGICFELEFLDNASRDTIITRQYIIDVNHIEGNPYKVVNFKRQYGIFDLDTANFIGVSKIYLFVEDFPHIADNKPADIFIKDIEFCGGIASSADELAAYGLVILTPQGTYFEEADELFSSRKLEAQVRIKGKNIDNNSQKLSYYWFIENVGVTVSSEKYCSYGGQGWQCLNSFNLIQDGVVEWVPGDYNYVVTKAGCPAKETKYKCVALYNDIVLSKEIIISNFGSDYEITIESDGGTQFYYDIGKPTLTCLINNEIKNDSNFTYLWAVSDYNGNFYSLSETKEANSEYNNAVINKEKLEKAIAAEEVMAAASQQELDTYLTTIEKYDTIMRIEGNRIHKLDVSSITNFSIYKCSVYYNGIFIGTSSIKIVNSLDNENGYVLVINNGTQVYKYDEAGVAPTSSSLEAPMSILPLTFTLYDNLGRAIENDVLRNCEIGWTVPMEDTMLEFSEDLEQGSSVDLINQTRTYKNILTLSYNIASRYNLIKTRNTIQLSVNYQGMILKAETNLTFTKEGEPGTNGTEFLCKIVPNTDDKDFSVYPMMINGEWNFNVKNKKQPFKVQLWHSGVKVFEGIDTNDLTQNNFTTEGKAAIPVWSNLKNKYTLQVSDNTDFPVDTTVKGSFNYNGYNGAESPANIIKCAISSGGITYYATMPIISVTTKDGYAIELVKDTGFRFATYSADGRTPQYDNSTPFTLKVTKNINGVMEDISTLTKNQAVNYDWQVRGKIYDPVNKVWNTEDYKFLTERLIFKSQVARNQAAYKPVENYNGECLNVALECILTDASATEIGRIHIPVHLLLNRYGNAAINDWDGNNVSIDENGSGVILAPQVGAGHKEKDNSFSGVLMGDVKESGKNVTETGLFGYHAGARTLFLNSEDGSAIFGKNGAGQLIIDPTQNKSYLYSNNYWKEYDVYGKPVDYTSENENNQGMLIDLTTPRIKFGNGNFIVTPEGHLTAKGGGSIAGWTINDDELTKNNIHINSKNEAIYSNGKSTFASNAEGFYIGNDGIKLGDTFNVTKEGVLTATEGHIAGWNIDDKQFQKTIGQYSFEIRSDRAANEAALLIYDNTNKRYNFYVRPDGFLYARNAEVNGKIVASEGQIADYTISGAQLIGNNVGLSGTSGQGYAFWAGSNTASSAPFRVGHNGSLYANNATIEGKITATSGTIGGCSINSDGNLIIPSGHVSGTFSAGKISGGTITGSHIHLNGGTVKLCTSGRVEFTNGVGFLSMGPSSSCSSAVGVTHPYVSALSVATGSGGISFRSGQYITDAGSELSHIKPDATYGASCSKMVFTNQLLIGKNCTVYAGVGSTPEPAVTGYLKLVSALDANSWYIGFVEGIMVYAGTSEASAKAQTGKSSPHMTYKA